MKKKLEEALKRIAELEARVRDLEARPIYMPIQVSKSAYDLYREMNPPPAYRPPPMMPPPNQIWCGQGGGESIEGQFGFSLRSEP